MSKILPNYLVVGFVLSRVNEKYFFKRTTINNDLVAILNCLPLLYKLYIPLYKIILLFTIK